MRGFLLMAMFVASLCGATFEPPGAAGESATSVDDVTGVAIDAGPDRPPSREPADSEGRQAGASFRVAGGDAEDDRETKTRTAL